MTMTTSAWSTLAHTPYQDPEWYRAAGMLDDLTLLSAGSGPGPDRVVTGRVEDRPQVVAAREAQALQDRGRLVTDRPDPLDDGGRIGISMRQGQVQVVQDRQPVTRHPDPLLGTRPLDIPSAPFAKIVHVGQGTQALILQFGDPCLQGIQAGPRADGAVGGWRDRKSVV